MKTILVIGAGATGSLCGFLLNKKFSNNLSVVIWEKNDYVGGRMITKHGADLGAQYITTTHDKLTKYSEIYTPLLEKNILVPLSYNIEGLKANVGQLNFVCPQGMSTLVEHFLTPETKLQKRVTGITKDPLKQQYRVVGNDETLLADFIISTVPVPEFLKISKPTIKKNELEKVEYSSRFALVLDFNETLERKCAYVQESDIRYLSLNNNKAMFHSTIQYGLKNIDKMSGDEKIKNYLEGEARKLVSLPKVTETYLHKWKYSQVLTPFQGKRGCVQIENLPGILLAGDAFTQSNFDGCIESALTVIDVITDLLRV